MQISDHWELAGEHDTRKTNYSNMAQKQALEICFEVSKERADRQTDKHRQTNRRIDSVVRQNNAKDDDEPLQTTSQLVGR